MIGAASRDPGFETGLDPAQVFLPLEFWIFDLFWISSFGFRISAGKLTVRQQVSLR